MVPELAAAAARTAVGMAEMGWVAAAPVADIMYSTKALFSCRSSTSYRKSRDSMPIFVVRRHRDVHGVVAVPDSAGGFRQPPDRPRWIEAPTESPPRAPGQSRPRTRSRAPAGMRRTEGGHLLIPGPEGDVPAQPPAAGVENLFFQADVMSPRHVGGHLHSGGCRRSYRPRGFRRQHGNDLRSAPPSIPPERAGPGCPPRRRQGRSAWLPGSPRRARRRTRRPRRAPPAAHPGGSPAAGWLPRSTSCASADRRTHPTSSLPTGHSRTACCRSSRCSPLRACPSVQ